MTNRKTMPITKIVPADADISGMYEFKEHDSYRIFIKYDCLPAEDIHIFFASYHYNNLTGASYV